MFVMHHISFITITHIRALSVFTLILTATIVHSAFNNVCRCTLVQNNFLFVHIIASDSHKCIPKTSKLKKSAAPLNKNRVKKM